jgi:SAM-dependent methyltransferase
MILKLSGTDLQWAHWGEVEPYYAVYTDPRYRSAAIKANVGDFFASGEAEAAGYLAFQDHMFPSRRFGRMLDFGCGVERLLLPLSQRYQHAVGVDVSPAMIALAKKHASDAGLSNVSFAASLDELEPGTFDYAHSTAVLQHLPVDRQMAATATILRLLAPGGIFSLQYGLADSEPGLSKTLKAVLRRTLEWGPIATLNRRLSIRDPNMRMVQAPLRDVLRLMRSASDGEVEATFQEEGSWDAVTLTGRRKA